MEPADQDGSRRRLDYHGRDNLHGRSLLVVEAKRPRLRLPDSSGESLHTSFANAFNAIHKQNTAVHSISVKWQKILESVVDYIRRIVESYGHAPTRFAISNGEWFVVISDLERSLLRGEAVADHVSVFEDTADIVSRADTFCSLLGYRRLSGHIPAQHPSALSDFIPAGEVATCARIVDVHYVRHGERQPLISVSIGVWIRIRRGAWVLFQKNYSNQFVILSDDTSNLPEELSRVKSRANDLLDELRAHHELRFASMDELEKALEDDRSSLDFFEPPSILVRAKQRDVYRVVTSEHVLYFTENSLHDDCRFHSWGPCRNDGSAVGDRPVVAPSTEPRCFFPSGSPYHCAHSAIQVRRSKVCLLLPFEEYLCCRRCVFLNRCWPEKDSMPCRAD